MYYNEHTLIYFNGRFVNAVNSTTDLYSQTMHYGYGVFEGIRSYNSSKIAQIFKAEDHFERLIKSCKLVNIPFDYTVKELVEITYQLLSKNNLKDAYIRPLVYCDQNMSLSKPNNVSLMICAWEWGAYLGNKQLHLKISSFCRPHPRSIHVEAKVCGHYINSILASSEAKTEGYDEALLLDCDGYLAEGPGANLFFEKNGILYTPQLGNILPGITRKTILEICENMNIKTEEGLYRPSDIMKANSAFYCGTATEIIGIKAINNYEFTQPWESSIGNKIHKAYKNLVLRK